MDKLTLQNFRCFHDPKPIPIRPLTILVGENSTGKSSFLSSIRLAWDIAYSQRRLNFNEEPFLLGAFDQIAHFRGGRAGRAQSFLIGFENETTVTRRKKAQLPKKLRLFHGAEFRKSGAQPVLSKQFLRCGDYSFVLSLSDGNAPPKIFVRTPHRKASRTLDEDSLKFRLSPEAPIDWFRVLISISEFAPTRTKERQRKPILPYRELDEIEDILMHARFEGIARPGAIAPIRTRPQRTYNPVSATPLPEGEHVPMVLAKTFFEDKEAWKSLKKALNRFGELSGLFSEVNIKALGRHESDPFQIRIKTEGPAANLVDVGYGVSQILPILVESLLAPSNSMYLLQQPEVHLHPRAQAALGTFLAEVAAQKNIKFVVETHSDYLIDRVRMDIRDHSTIRPSDVSILFFEREGIESNIHPIKIDKAGNLENFPSSYREFFLKEESRFLGA